MRRKNKIISKWFGKSFTKLFILAFFIIVSCHKENISLIDNILGNYDTEFRTYTFPQSCPNGASMLDVGSKFTIKKSSNNLENAIEIHFESLRGSIWYGQLKADTLYFPKQVVATTNPDYLPGPNEIKGLVYVKNGIIEFKIEELYTANKYIQVCNFSGKRK